MSQSTPTQHEIDAYAGEFVLCGVKSKAWVKAYPESKCGPESVHTKANSFHKSVEVLLRIEELQSETAQKDAEEFDLSVSELKKRLKEVMDAGLTGRVDSQGDSSPANLGAAVSAVSEFNRMNGNHAAQKINANVVTMSHEEWLGSLDE